MLSRRETEKKMLPDCQTVNENQGKNEKNMFDALHKILFICVQGSVEWQKQKADKNHEENIW